MPSRVSRNGHSVITTDYELRTLDAFGDAIDVELFESLADARAATERALAMPNVKAWVIEKHVSVRPAYGAPDRYTTIATGGDTGALALGGWIP